LTEVIAVTLVYERSCFSNYLSQASYPLAAVARALAFDAFVVKIKFCFHWWEALNWYWLISTFLLHLPRWCVLCSSC